MPLPSNLSKEVISIKRDISIPLYGGTRIISNDDVLTTRGRNQYKAYDDLLKDPHCKSVVGKRQLAVVSREWSVEPATSSRIDKKAADMVIAQLKGLGTKAPDYALDVFGLDATCLNLLDAVLKGFSVGEIIWNQDGGEIYVDQIKPRNQQSFGFGIGDDGHELRWLTLEDMVKGEPVAKNYPRKFLVHSFGSKDGNPYGVGLGHCLWWSVFFKRQGIKFWLSFIDKFAAPTAVGKYPKGATEQQKKTLLLALDAIAHDAGVAIPEGMEIELLEASRSGSINCYESLARYMDSEMSKATLGETLSTDIGTHGSYAASKTHNEVRKELVKADADLLSDTLNRTLIRWIVELNLPGAKPPRLWRNFDESEDLNSRVQRDKTLFDMGWKLKNSAISEIYGDHYEPIPLQGGEATDEEFLANSGVQEKSNPAKKDTADMSEFADLSTSPRLPTASNFTETLSNASDLYTKQLTSALAPIITNWIEQISQLVEESESFEEVRDRIFDLYPQLDTASFAEVMGQALVASEAAARWEVINEAGEI